jgi:hypothetical protein
MHFRFSRDIGEKGKLHRLPGGHAYTGARQSAVLSFAVQAEVHTCWLALWGLAGYAIFATGALLELLGFSYGLTLSIPGGIFELVFGIGLFTKGVGRADSIPTGIAAL